MKLTTEQKCRKVLLEQSQISLFHCVEAAKGISYTFTPLTSENTVERVHPYVKKKEKCKN